ncbi:hypothetical protein QT972_18315 [Microcoleus sp. herbarium7]
MLHTIGSLVLVATAAVAAIPICALCSTFGFTGVAALAGAGFMMSVIPSN